MKITEARRILKQFCGKRTRLDRLYSLTIEQNHYLFSTDNRMMLAILTPPARARSAPAGWSRLGWLTKPMRNSGTLAVADVPTQEGTSVEDWLANRYRGRVYPDVLIRTCGTLLDGGLLRETLLAVGAKTCMAEWSEDEEAPVRLSGPEWVALVMPLKQDDETDLAAIPQLYCGDAVKVGRGS